MTPIEQFAATALDNAGTGVQSVGIGGILVYLRRISNNASQALRILQGEDDVDQDDGLIGRVEETEQRSQHNEQRLDRAGIYTDSGDQDV